MRIFLNGMKWDEILFEWDGMGWDGMRIFFEWDGMG